MNPLAPSARPDYWEQGIDPTTGKFGISADKHPDYRDRHRRLVAIEHERQALRDREMDAFMAYARTTAEPKYSDWLASPDGQDIRNALADLSIERRDILATIDTELYRTGASSTSGLSIRYDKVGKAAWTRELRRLGRVK